MNTLVLAFLALGLAALTLVGLGFAVAALLTLGSRVFTVDDPHVDAVLEALPGANCGACGYAGCQSYAQAVVREPTIPTDLCVPGGPGVSHALATLTGKAMGTANGIGAPLVLPLLSEPSADAEAPAQVCPAGAIAEENGRAFVFAKKCTHCHGCEHPYPYHSPSDDEAGRSVSRVPAPRTAPPPGATAHHHSRSPRASV